jgi:hypothetical protein
MMKSDFEMTGSEHSYSVHIAAEGTKQLQSHVELILKALVAFLTHPKHDEGNKEIASEE